MITVSFKHLFIVMFKITLLADCESFRGNCFSLRNMRYFLDIYLNIGLTFNTYFLLYFILGQFLLMSFFNFITIDIFNIPFTL